MTIFTPTKEQQDAIDYDNSCIITACPGSGKTTVIKEKIRNLFCDLNDYQGVIAITFTRKASDELRRRCQENAQDTKASFFGTIDSFCLKELILPFLNRIWGGEPSKCKIIKKLNSDQKLYFSEQYKSPTCDDINSDDGFKNLYVNGILWMGSFAALSVLILKESSSAQNYIKARYSHIFIDEYQDSSQAQHEIFMSLYELGLIATAVGDIDQSIYQFRGSQPEYLAKLIEDTKNFYHFRLSLNHRCHTSIINYASRIIDPEFPLIPIEDDIHVYRRKLDGNLINAAQQITVWIQDWLKDKKISKASDIAVLGKKESSLAEFSSGLGVGYRLFIDTPLNDIGTECADIYSDLLLYKYGAISTALDVVEKHFWQLDSMKVSNIIKILKDIRIEQSIELFIIKCNALFILIDIDDFEAENNAVREIWNNDLLLKLFKPDSEDEVQIMTLHKSKGLEFKIVFHIDMEEWSFPYQEKGESWDDIVYPSLDEDTSLHYVGITRAEQCCILVRTSLRKNAKGEYKSSSPSYFLTLPQLEGLYK
ncbi:ATP-dependent helicase [Wohlfahrtiimonas chitiniclastica]|uniref:UvrD-helicase domain-containing protein n=1 Tax=Wohlfahrtiimonas chitiniclastica TaxID=400946 RepID=UPI001BD0B0B5|nr:ATP-dependent helicase [Wohlfahrtiimonas chitiniclastica]MBS7815111.1 ATP-dependent helicase [Wohlfahrtiimonas chitiniclastica]